MEEQKPPETRKFVIKHEIDVTTRKNFYGDDKIWVKYFGGDWDSYVHLTNCGPTAFVKYRLPESYDKEWSAKVTARLINQEENVFEQVLMEGNERFIGYRFEREQMGKNWRDRNAKNGTIVVEVHVELTAHFPLVQKEKKWDFSQAVKGLSDVALLVGEEKFHVNKATLANHSTYFYAMFFNDYVESTKSEIELVDVDPKMFQYLLEIIYHAPDVNEYNVESLLEIALFYDMKPVFTQCEKFLISSTFFPPVQKSQLAEQYGFEELKNHLETMAKKENKFRRDALKTMRDGIW